MRNAEHKKNPRFLDFVHRPAPAGETFCQNDAMCMCCKKMYLDKSGGFTRGKKPKSTNLSFVFRSDTKTSVSTSSLVFGQINSSCSTHCLAASGCYFRSKSTHFVMNLSPLDGKSAALKLCHFFLPYPAVSYLLRWMPALNDEEVFSTSGTFLWVSWCNGAIIEWQKCHLNISL